MILCSNALRMFYCMQEAIFTYGYNRQSADAASPQQNSTVEAEPGQTFVLINPRFNLLDCDVRWARANLLHFFAATEAAEMLERYNARAPRFVADGVWHGAYGAIAVPQLKKCLAKLKEYIHTRRAVVTMGGLEHDDINRPACWSFLQFLYSSSGLDLLVYQRSLNMSVMPYDLVVLTNVLLYMSAVLNVTSGCLRWTIGSLHATCATSQYGILYKSLTYPADVLQDSEQCLRRLRADEL